MKKNTLPSFSVFRYVFYIGNSHSTYTAENKTTGSGQVLLPTRPWGTCFPYKELSGTNGSVVHSIHSFFQPALSKCLLHLKPRAQKDEIASLQELTGLKTQIQLLDIPASNFVLQSPFLPKQPELYLKTYKSNHIPLCLKLSFASPLILKIKSICFPMIYIRPDSTCLSYHPPNLQFYSNTNFSLFFEPIKLIPALGHFLFSLN